MFDVEPMSKIRVLCAKKDLDSVVESLYSFGAIHVTRSSAFSPGSPSSKLEFVSTMLVKLRAVESTLGAALKKTSLSKAPSGSLQDLEKQFLLLNLGEFDFLAGKKQELEARLNELGGRKKELSAFKTLEVDLRGLAAKTSLLEFAVFETINAEKALSAARDFGQAVLAGVGSQKLLVAWDKRKAEKARTAVSAFAREIPLPQAEESFAREYSLAEKDLGKAQAQLSEINRALQLYALKHGGKIISLRKGLEVEFKKSELPSKFGQSSLAASAEGWIPAKLYARLDYALREKAGDKIVLEKIETKESPPSRLQNFIALKPFEFMIEFFSLPRYKELDPTFITALTFPLFFGMILGDIGYGLVLLLLGAFLAMKFKKGFLSSVGGMMVLSAISTIIFGFVFAEFFGLEQIFGMHLTPLLSRVHEQGINQLIALSVLVGFLHITLGLVLGVWQGIREKHYSHSYAKAAWLLIEFGFVSFIVNNMSVVFTDFLHPLKIIFPSPVDLGLFVAGAAILVKTEGVIQLFEIPSLFANILSYLRLMALGLSGVALAGIINLIPVDFASLSSLNPMAWAGLLLAVIALVLGHAMVLGLGLMEAGIQSLRLHYVEFYSKFYKGGGTAFVPLRED